MGKPLGFEEVRIEHWKLTNLVVGVSYEMGIPHFYRLAEITIDDIDILEHFISETEELTGKDQQTTYADHGSLVNKNVKNRKLFLDELQDSVKNYQSVLTPFYQKRLQSF